MPTQLFDIPAFNQFLGPDASEVAVLLKHSSDCPSSQDVFNDLVEGEQQGLFDLHFVDCKPSPTLWWHLKEKNLPGNIKHESPQVFILQEGAVRAAAHHSAVTTDWVVKEIAALKTSPEGEAA